ncbi:glycine cleavage system protein GcvH [Hydrocarboniclastica marina]|uniref:Glycine cleavage system H protein n=1 Tax=Hydrocarboniclastica marina TaxID=2259620 RepID=A0A4P7XEQ5_9ALTE|nr:glycine cleavage system protein GcvH [Hydrocarboniclastica marina]QCF25033.1 glycine cleavage system protein GcvH [Hydrocarboniclastica marina]
MSKVPGDLRYNATHQWVRLEGDIATVGITDFAQEQLGDVVYVELPEVGDQVTAAEEAGGVESVKSASDIYSPVSGEVVDINGALEDSPEIVNESPYQDGWLFKLRLDGATLPADLLTAESYSELLPAK